MSEPKGASPDLAALLAEREWQAEQEAPEAALAALRERAPVPLPFEYLDLLSFGNGGEGPLPVLPFYLLLYPAEEAAEIHASGTFNEHFPGLFVIGSSGGGEAIALDLRAGEPWSIVCFDMTNTDLSESVVAVAPNMASFLQMIGVEEGAGAEATLLVD